MAERPVPFELVGLDRASAVLAAIAQAATEPGTDG